MKTLISFHILFSIVLSLTLWEPVSMYHTLFELEQLIKPLLSYADFKEGYCIDEPNYKYIDIGQDDAKVKVVLVCNIHARQILVSEVCVQWMRQLIQEQQADLLEGIKYRVFYQANDQRDHVVIDRWFCKRTNRNDVDLNRNFPTGWKPGQSGTETYSGQYPLSQPFSQCLEQAVLEIEPTAFLDIHTGQFTIYQSDTNPPQLNALLQQIKSEFCQTCHFKDASKSGEAFYDMAVRHFIKYTALFQIYGGYKADYDTEQQLCFAIFNPMTPNSLQFYIQKWVQSLNFYFRGIKQLQM